MIKYLTLLIENNYLSILYSPNLLKQSTDERDINVPKTYYSKINLLVL